MRPKRLSASFLSIVGLVVVLSRPVAAQSVNRELIDTLNYQLLAAAVPLALFVEVILVYAVWRFRENDDPEPTAEDRRLEITWTVATAVILVLVGFLSFTVLQSPYISPVAGQTEQGSGDGPYLQGAIEPDEESALVVDVVAYRWGWRFTYEGTDVTTDDRLVLPTDREIYLHVTSRAVIHSFYAPALGLKQDAFPSQYNTIHTRLTETGEYRFHCAEYCGAGHARMSGTVVAVSPERFEQWLDARTDGSTTDGGPESATGRAPFDSGPRAGSGATATGPARRMAASVSSAAGIPT